MFINDKPIESLGGIMLGTPRISNAEYTSNYEKMRTRSTIRHLAHDVGVKKIECHIAFLGDSIHAIQLKRSAFRAALIGLLDLSFKSDSFFYFAEYKGEMELESEHGNAVVSTFEFRGIQHLPLEVVTGKKFICKSTVPQTDCKITTTATSNSATAQVGTVTFNSVVAGDILCADGMNGLITKNGQPVKADFIRLPYLVSGENEIACTYDNIKIEYYPTFL
jgi:hypothetical protein